MSNEDDIDYSRKAIIERRRYLYSIMPGLKEQIMEARALLKVERELCLQRQLQRKQSQKWWHWRKETILSPAAIDMIIRGYKDRIFNILDEPKALQHIIVTLRKL